MLRYVVAAVLGTLPRAQREWAQKEKKKERYEKKSDE